MQDFVSETIKTLAKDLGTGNALVIFSLIMARMITIVTLVPFLGSKNAPGPVKIGLALMLTVLVWPLASSGAHEAIPSGVLVYLLLMMKEVFIGFAIGFVTAQIFYAVEIAGQIIDVVRFTNQIQIIVPETGERSSPYGDIYYQLALIIFLALGLHAVFFEALIESFIAVPVSQMPAFSSGVEPFYNEFMYLAGEIFKIAVTLALPIGAVCLMINITFGLINRVAPQINAYFLSMPAVAIGGMAISFFALSMTVDRMQHYSEELIVELIKVVRLLG